MKHFYSLLAILGLLNISCTNSDNDSSNDYNYIKKITITSYDDKNRLREDDFFYEASQEFKYNQANYPIEINHSMTYRDMFTFDEVNQIFPNEILERSVLKKYTYKKGSNQILEETTIQEGKTSQLLFTYTDKDQIATIKEEDKETQFSYNEQGQLETISTTYNNQHSDKNSVQKLRFDDNNNLIQLIYYTSNNQESTTYIFEYSTLKSVYKNDPINYTLLDEYEDINTLQVYGYTGLERRYYPNFLDHIEFVYKGYHLVNKIHKNYGQNHSETYSYEVTDWDKKYDYIRMGSRGFSQFYYQSEVIK